MSRGVPDRDPVHARRPAARVPLGGRGSAPDHLFARNATPPRPVRIQTKESRSLHLAGVAQPHFGRALQLGGGLTPGDVHALLLTSPVSRERTVRVEARVQGDFLFPSTRTGKPWGKESQYKCARAVLQDAGLDSSEGGSFRLRHTFALRQLRRGFGEKTVTQDMVTGPETGCANPWLWRAAKPVTSAP